MNHVEIAQDELLREAQKSGNQIYKLNDGTGTFVKARRGYSYPQEVRELYNQAFDNLMRTGRLKRVLKNHALELYEVVASDGAIITKRNARRVLLQAVKEHGYLYKIHSTDGEFVQAGPNAFWQLEEERILFLQALAQLFREGRLSPIHDSRELTCYEARLPRFSRLDDDDEELVVDEPIQTLYAVGDPDRQSGELPKTA